MQQEKLDELLSEFIESALDFGQEVRAEESHGNGIDKNNRTAFIRHFGAKLQKVNDSFNKLKE